MLSFISFLLSFSTFCNSNLDSSTDSSSKALMRADTKFSTVSTVATFSDAINLQALSLGYVSDKLVAVLSDAASSPDGKLFYYDGAISVLASSKEWGDASDPLGSLPAIELDSVNGRLYAADPDAKKVRWVFYVITDHVRIAARSSSPLPVPLCCTHTPMPFPRLCTCVLLLFF